MVNAFSVSSSTQVVASLPVTACFPQIRNIARVNCKYVIARGWLALVRNCLNAKYQLVRASAANALAAIAGDPYGRDFVQQDLQAIKLVVTQLRCARACCIAVIYIAMVSDADVTPRLFACILVRRSKRCARLHARQWQVPSRWTLPSPIALNDHDHDHARRPHP